MLTTVDKALAVAAIAAVSISTSASAENLVINGSFEEPLVVSPVHAVYRTGTELTGWLYVGPGNGIVHQDSLYPSFSPVHSGNQAVQLEVPLDSLSQVLPTTIGTTYELTFFLSAHDQNGSLTRISFGSAIFDISASNLGFAAHSLLYTAVAATTTLSFQHVGSTAMYSYLDTVSVSSVPEPSSMIMLTLGLLCLGIVRQACTSDA